MPPECERSLQVHFAFRESVCVCGGRGPALPGTGALWSSLREGPAGSRSGTAQSRAAEAQLTKGSQHETWGSILRAAESGACDRESLWEVTLGHRGQWVGSRYWQWEWERFENLGT